MKKFLAVFHARNLEFFRDRSALGWNLIFPVLIVFGFAFAYSGGDRPMFKVGVIKTQASAPASQTEFLKTRYIEFVFYESFDEAIDKVRRHQLALLLDPENTKKYWLNQDSPNGYVAEKMLQASDPDRFTRETVSGRALRYVDWLLPGILAMNMMFSCLFGVGYTIVRYRKNGVLKRLKATPLTAFEFLAAQVVSRLAIVLLVSAVIFLGCVWSIDIPVNGSYLALILVAALGGMSLISLGLVIAARSSSEELAGGLLNLISWPMMFLSGVWFSLEGTAELLQKVALVLPLTHFIDAAREIMNNGAGLIDVMPQVVTLAAMTLVFLIVGSVGFRWDSK